MSVIMQAGYYLAQRRTVQEHLGGDRAKDNCCLSEEQALLTHLVTGHS